MADEERTPDTPPVENPANRPGTAHHAVQDYIDHAVGVVRDPDGFFDPATRSPRLNGFITLGLYLLMVFLTALFARITRFSDWDFEGRYLTDAFQAVLAVALPIVAITFAWAWQAGRGQGGLSVDFYIEKFGAALILPLLLMLLAVPLDILDLSLGGWFRGAAMVFVYIAVFGISYRYATAGRLLPSALFTLAFYFAYRLLLQVF